jgi:hypothetical protein
MSRRFTEHQLVWSEAIAVMEILIMTLRGYGTVEPDGSLG